MTRSVVASLLLAGLWIGLPGCYFAAGTGKAPWKEQPVTTMAERADPAIRGAWSEPVNGLRMAVRQITSDEAEEEVLLLLLVENVSDQAIEWRGFRPQRVVHVVANGEYLVNPPPGQSGNLQIKAEPIGGGLRSKIDILWNMQEEMQQLGEMLLPGEIRMHAIRLHDTAPMKLQLEMQKRIHEIIESDRVLWPGLLDGSSRGEWRLTLTYRSDGKFPPAGQTHDQLQQTEDAVEAELIGEPIQIDLPALEFKWWPAEKGPIDEQVQSFQEHR